MGGSLFGAFPLAYATILNALYLPAVVMVVGLILRAVSFEFRENADNKLVWNIAFGVAVFWPPWDKDLPWEVFLRVSRLTKLDILLVEFGTG